MVENYVMNLDGNYLILTGVKYKGIPGLYELLSEANPRTYMKIKSHHQNKRQLSVGLMLEIYTSALAPPSTPKTPSKLTVAVDFCKL